MKCPPTLLTVVCLLGAASAALAERVPESKESASHVVTAKVKDVFARDSKGGLLAETYTHFVAQLEVDGVEKGDTLRPGQVLYAHCFQRTREAIPPAAGMRGHSFIPKPEQRIRAYLNRKPDGSFEFVYPNGLDFLDGKAPASEFVRESAAGPSLLSHGWSFLLGAACVLAVLLWRGLRKRAAYAPVQSA